LDVAHGEFQWGKKAWDRLPCAVNSFPADTVVHARPQGASSQDAQQARTTLTPISQLQVSDEVLAIAEWKDKGSNPKQDQRLSYEKVTDIFTSFKEQTLIHLTLANGEQLTATDGHPFNTPEGWRDAIVLKKGGKLLLPGEAQGMVEITQIAHRIETLTTYNLEVAQAASAHQEIPGHERERRQNTNLVRRIDLCADCYCQKGASTQRLSRHFATDSIGVRFRKNPAISSLCRQHPT
jgi:hypothetical protein